MNKAELILAIIADTHRDYGDDNARFVNQGEALIRTELVAYGLEYTFTDVDRIVPDSPIYNFPAGGVVVQVRHILYNDCRLDALDEQGLSMYRDSTTTKGYAIRPATIAFAGSPASDATLHMQYFGLPEVLDDDSDTNQLLTDYPQLYIDAAAVYVYRRAQDYESANIALSSMKNLSVKINRKIRRLLGSPNAAPAYNTSFRSSY